MDKSLGRAQAEVLDDDVAMDLESSVGLELGSGSAGSARQPLVAIDLDDVSAMPVPVPVLRRPPSSLWSDDSSQNDSQSTQGGALVCINNENCNFQQTRRLTTHKLQELSSHDYAGMPHGMCVMVAGRASQALSKEAAKYKEATRQMKALKRANQLQQQTIQKKQRLLDEARSKSSLEIVTLGKSGCRITKQSMFAVGIRRNLSNIAAADFGATVLQAISHQRVCRCEVRTGAAILARMRHQCSRAKAADSTPWALTVVSFRCDATNSSIWRREKLHVLDVDLAWVKDHEAAKAFNARGAFECHRCLS